ncbi:MAG: polysaccharide pyruvyl transferase family protein, partial [Acidimicrobiia bacterium]
MVLTGTYSSHNKGDMAMQLVMARELKSRGCNVASSVPFLETDMASYAAHGVPVFASNRRKLVRATWQLVRLMVWRLLRRVSGAHWIVPDADLERIRAADLVVDLSGDMLTDDYGPHVAYSHYLPLLAARLCGTPYAIVAQSIGPFRYTQPLARTVLRNACLVTVRDELSIAHVASLGLPEPILTADLAFLLESAPSDAVAWPSGDVLGVSVSKLMESHYQRRNPQAGSRSFADVMAGDLDAVARRHGLAVVFFPQVTGPGIQKDDRVAGREVACRME